MPELMVKKGRGELVAAVILTAVIVTSLRLAIKNLIDHVAVLPSAIWIILVLSVTLSNLRASGIGKFHLTILSTFSRYQLLRVSAHPLQPTLEIGFTLFGLPFIELRIARDDVVCVYWHSGQATEMSGRDANDWSVFLRYRHHDAQKEMKERERGRKWPGQSLIVIGPARSKGITEALGNRVLDFLSASGFPPVNES